MTCPASMRLNSVTCAPIASAICRQIDNPSPTPPCPAENGWNNRCRTASSMPGPSSHTSTSRCPVLSRSSTPSRPWTGVWWMALASRLRISSPSSAASPGAHSVSGPSSAKSSRLAAISGASSITASRAIAFRSTLGSSPMRLSCSTLLRLSNWLARPEARSTVCSICCSASPTSMSPAMAACSWVRSTAMGVRSWWVASARKRRCSSIQRLWLCCSSAKCCTAGASSDGPS